MTSTLKIKRIILYLIALYLLTSCDYIKSVFNQNKLLQNQKTNPGLQNLKHILDGETFTVYGLVLDKSGKRNNQSLAVAAYSDKYKPHELVDVTHFASIDTHYVLNLPAGKYDFLVLADNNKNNLLEDSEVVARRQVELNLSTNSEKVLTGFDLNLSDNDHVNWQINIPVPETPEIEQSLVYPKGAIRKLNDPIFGSELSTLGMYEPSAFLERAPSLFYALEDYLPYKIPVIFVHGIGGTAREFIPIINKMDREHYVPWFFYYPSGNDLNDSAEIFNKLLLSGKLFPKIGTPMIIVAHSMGGLVAREALNLQQGTEAENKVELLITLASPFAGHPQAASGVKHAPIVLPAWRDLNPEGQFIENLFRKPLPSTVKHQLLYAYANPDTFKPVDNSDGVVPIYSQLRPVAQEQSSLNYGFNSSHTGILKNESAIDHVIKSIQSVKGSYLESHINAIKSGGYNIELDGSYSNQEKYIINVLGQYLAGLWQGKLKAVTSFQKHFVLVSQGKASASHFTEKTWIKFIEQYPDILDTEKT